MIFAAATPAFQAVDSWAGAAASTASAKPAMHNATTSCFMTLRSTKAHKLQPAHVELAHGIHSGRPMGCVNHWANADDLVQSRLPMNDCR